jgi:hypothetical protein
LSWTNLPAFGDASKTWKSCSSRLRDFGGSLWLRRSLTATDW